MSRGGFTSGGILSGGASYDASSLAIFAAMTTPPSTQRKTDINNTVVSLKSAGIWSGLDRLWMLWEADTQASLLNWIDPTNDPLIPSGSPTFTADRGYTGNGSTMSLANTTLFSGMTQFIQNSACLAVFVRTGGANGCVGQPTDTYIGLEPSDGVNCNFSCNSNFGSIANVANLTGTGFFMADRSDSANVSAYLDGVLLGTVAKSSAAPQADVCCVLRGLSAFFTGQVSAVAIGSSQALNAVAFNTIIRAYKTAVGA